VTVEGENDGDNGTLSPPYSGHSRLWKTMIPVRATRRVAEAHRGTFDEGTPDDLVFLDDWRVMHTATGITPLLRMASP